MPQITEPMLNDFRRKPLSPNGCWIAFRPTNLPGNRIPHP